MADATVLVGRIARLRAGRAPVLLLGRVVEQCALGGVAIYLAARLGPVAFAPISMLFVVNTIAVTVSDYGVGLSALRCAPGETVARAALTRMRAINIVIALAAPLVGLLVGGTLGWIVAGAGPIWWASSEAFVRKAAAINRGAAAEAARGEMIGAGLFAVVAVAAADLGTPVAWIALAFLVKHIAEASCVHSWRATFTADGRPVQFGSLCSAQGLALVAGSLDYVLVGVFFGASAFSIYTLGFRVAVAVPSIVAYVAGRTAVADFAARTGTELDACHRSYVRRLFNVGLVGGICGVAAAVVLAPVLGGDWHDIGPTVLVLSVAMPWRTMFGQAGSLLLATGQSRRLARWEVVRVVVSGVALSIAGLVSYPVFVTTAAVSWIVIATVTHRLAAQCSGITAWRFTAERALVGLVLCGAVAMAAGWS